MEEVTIIIFCTWKFAAMFPVAIYAMGMTSAETFIYTNIGGILGTVSSVYFSHYLIQAWKKYWPEKLKFRRKTRKIFTKRRRRFVKIKSNYGLAGIVMLTPVILSIPVGSFLVVKYYGKSMKNTMFLVAGQVFWSLVYILFYTQVKTMIA